MSTKKQFKLDTLQALAVAHTMAKDDWTAKYVADKAASLCEEAERRGWFKEPDHD